MYYVNYITQENLIVSQFKTMHPKLFLYSLLASSYWLFFFFFMFSSLLPNVDLYVVIDSKEMLKLS